LQAEITMTGDLTTETRTHRDSQNY